MTTKANFRMVDGVPINLKDFGAVGDYTTDDTTALENALVECVDKGTSLYVPRGVYRLTRSIDFPAKVQIKGEGNPYIATFPQVDGDKENLRPGFKHQISGSVFIWTAVDSSFTTSRSDQYDTMTYMARTVGDNSKVKISDIAFIQDMDVRDAGGALTTAANDNRLDVDAGLIVDSYAGTYTNFTLFGYFNKAGLVVYNADDTSSFDPDYNAFLSCVISGGTAVIGSTTASSQGLTGTRFVDSGLYGADHHTRDDGDYTIPALYNDGLLNGGGKIRGLSTTACNIRTYANDAIVLDNCDDVNFTNNVYEFSVLVGVPNADILGGFVGTANTGDVQIIAGAATNDLRLPQFAQTVQNKVQIIGAGSVAAGDMYAGFQGRGLRISPSFGDAAIQFTDDISTINSGFILAYDEAARRLDYRYQGQILGGYNVDTGGLANGGLGAAPTTNTISGGNITIGSGQFIRVATEGAASSDNLDNIIDGNDYEGKILYLRAASASRTVVVKHNTNGGNIRLQGQTDFTMDNSSDILQLIKVGGQWLEVCRSDNAA